MLKPAPLIEPITSGNGKIGSIWALWMQALVNRGNEGAGVSGTFTTADAKTVTVTNGIITDIT